MGSIAQPTTNHDQVLHRITISDSLRKDGKPTNELIAEAAAFLHKDGIIILENAIDIAHIDHLNSVLVPEALEVSADPHRHFNFGRQTRNMDQAPPPVRELMYKDIWANSFVCAIMAAVLGPKPTVHYAMGNTALQTTAEGRQPVHSDCEFDHPVYFPFAYVVNINLVDTSSENGATEFWPGSHHVSTPECHSYQPGSTSERLLHIRPEALESRRQHSPPIQPSTKRGSLIIRDLRLWHAGRPNMTADPRIMLAFVIQPAWFQSEARVQLPLAVKDLIESWEGEIHFAAEWVEGEVDHKRLNSATVDFSSGNRSLQRYQTDLSRWPEYAPRWY